MNSRKIKIVVIVSIIIAVGLGTITYFAWPKKNKSVESQTPTNSQSEIQKLQTELNSVKSKLSNLSDTTQKTQFENELSDIENQIKNLSSQDNPTIKNLEREIKEIKQKLESGDKPNENPKPSNKKEERLAYRYPLIGENTGYYVFDNSFMPSGDQKILVIIYEIKLKSLYTLFYLMAT